MTDQLMDDLTNEEHEALLLMSEHGIAAPLSPAAKAVLDAATQYEINPECYSREIAAAALRAAADQLGYHRAPGVDLEDLYGRIVEVGDLLAIAAELEGAGA